MASMSEAQRAMAQRAMMLDLGVGRIDALPLEDGEGGKKSRDTRTYIQTPSLSNGGPPIVRKKVDSRWYGSIDDGAFQDDDAAGQSGVDDMNNGQLARERRNAARYMASGFGTASGFDEQHHEKNMRRDENGNVPPRATGPRGGRGNLQGRVPAGDGPVDIAASLKGDASRPRTSPSAPVSRAATRGGPAPAPAQTPSRPVAPHFVSSATRKAAPNVSTQLAGSQTQASASASDTEPQARLVLPTGASVVLQLPASFSAAVLPKKMPKYRGILYLISGFEPSEDMVIISVEDENVDDIRRLVSEYDTYMSMGNSAFMLKFSDSNACFQFYAVELQSPGDATSFIASLGNMVKRRRRLSRSSVSGAALSETATNTGAGTSVAKVALPEPPSVISQPQSVVSTPATQRTGAKAFELPVTTTEDCAIRIPDSQVKVKEQMASTSASEALAPVEAPTDGLQTDTGTSTLPPATRVFKSACVVPAPASESKYVEPVVSTAPQTPNNAEAPSVLDSPPQQISPEIVEEIANWAWESAQVCCHDKPNDFGFDALRSVIRTACVVAMSRNSPSFQQLSIDAKKRIVDTKIQPHVERAFLKRLVGNNNLAADLLTTEARAPEAGQIEARPSVALEPEAGQVEAGQVAAQKTEDSLPEARHPETHESEARQAKPAAQAEAPPVVSAKPSEHAPAFYPRDQLMNLRERATPFALPDTLRQLMEKPAIHQPKPNLLPRLSIEDQVKRTAASANEFLYASKGPQIAGAIAGPGTSSGSRFEKSTTTNSDVDGDGDVGAGVFAPIANQTPDSPPAGLSRSIHNRGNAQAFVQNTNRFTGLYAPKKKEY